MDNIIKDNQFRSGFVALMGKPNVGKSTLLNNVINHKIAATSPRPQTTRKKQLGILTLKNAQIIFVDTPGIHTPRNKLGEKMNTDALKNLEDCDLILLMFDVSMPPQSDDKLLISQVRNLKHKPKTILVFNKIDRISDDTIDKYCIEYMDLFPNTPTFKISAIENKGVDDLLNVIIKYLPFGPMYYPENQLTDTFERDLSSDLMREACLKVLNDEIPHGIAIRIDQFSDRNDQTTYIEATIFVERESHKAIVIGKEGSMIKRIGTLARKEIEALINRKVFLQLRVKVRKNWRNDEKMLKWLGY